MQSDIDVQANKYDRRHGDARGVTEKMVRERGNTYV